MARWLDNLRGSRPVHRRPANPFRRLLPNLGQAITRIFTAAGVTRLTNDWGTTPLSSDDIVYRNQRSLRARSREQYANNDFAAKYISMLADNVVGSEGIQLQSRYDLGTPEENKAINDQVEELWRDWSRPENCDARGNLSWVDIQRQAIQGVGYDGEFLARIDVDGTLGAYRFRLLALDPELLDIDFNKRAIKGGGYIRLGIEYGSDHRPVAYWLIDPDAVQTGQKSRKHIRFPAEEIIHIFFPAFVGQNRGLPLTSTALYRLKMLGAYEEAALVAARVGAAKMAAIETTDGDREGDGEDADGNKFEDADPGGYFRLAPGEKLNAWSPEYPRGEFPEFVKCELRAIASGLGVSYNTLASDLVGVSYSSIRQGVLDEREQWKTKQSRLVTTLFGVIFPRWLRYAATAGVLQVPPSALPRIVARVHCQPRRWEWVSPIDDSQATQSEIDGCRKSYSEAIREKGKDPETVWAQLASDKAQMKKYGLQPISKASASTSNPTDPEPVTAPAVTGGDEDAALD